MKNKLYYIIQEKDETRIIKNDTRRVEIIIKQGALYQQEVLKLYGFEV
jgi:hypothetical protein